MKRFDTELAKLEAKAREMGKYDEWMALRRALATHATLLEQEKAFKANCRRQMVDLQARLDTLKSSSSAGGGADGDSERLALAEEAHSAAKDKHRRMRALLGRKNREL